MMLNGGLWRVCFGDIRKLFYKRECQEKYFAAELKARRDWLAFSPWA